jgi:hypothetical protein
MVDCEPRCLDRSNCLDSSATKKNPGVSHIALKGTTQWLSIGTSGTGEMQLLVCSSSVMVMVYMRVSTPSHRQPFEINCLYSFPHVHSIAWLSMFSLFTQRKLPPSMHPTTKFAASLALTRPQPPTTSADSEVPIYMVTTHSRDKQIVPSDLCYLVATVDSTLQHPPPLYVLPCRKLVHNLCLQPLNSL